jgi:hypothetical protein
MYLYFVRYLLYWFIYYPFYLSTSISVTWSFTACSFCYSTYMYTVKRVDGKLRQLDRMTQYSSISGTENFFYLQIKLIRWVLKMVTDYFDISGIFLRFSVLPDFGKQPLDHSFPTILEIFRNVSAIENEIELSRIELTTFCITIHCCTAAPYFLTWSSYIIFVSMWYLYIFYKIPESFFIKCLLKIVFSEKKRHRSCVNLL